VRVGLVAFSKDLLPLWGLCGLLAKGGGRLRCVALRKRSEDEAPSARHPPVRASDETDLLYMG